MVIFKTTSTGGSSMDDSMISEDFERIVSEFSPIFSGKNVLVTGGAGFLGSWLCDVFVGCGSNVDCLDNMSTSNGCNIDHFRGKVNLITESVERADLSRHNHDFIFNFSSRASPDEYIQHPVETLSANSLGVLNVLEHAKESSSIVVHASTSEIYGDPAIVPTPESYYGNTNSVGVRSCYDEGKRFAEAACMAFFRQYNTDVKLVRIFNSYGPRIRADGLYGRALPRFVKQALNDEEITIYGNGLQTRSFCYVSDTIRGILKVAALKSSGVVLNIGNPVEIRILELARRIIELTSSKSSLVFAPLMQDDPRRRCPDISMAKHVLNWSPQVSLEDGLRKTIRWFEDQGISRMAKTVEIS